MHNPSIRKQVGVKGSPSDSVLSMFQALQCSYSVLLCCHNDNLVLLYKRLIGIHKVWVQIFAVSWSFPRRFRVTCYLSWYAHVCELCIQTNLGGCVCCYTVRGVEFFLRTFASEPKTLIYDVSTTLW